MRSAAKPFAALCPCSCNQCSCDSRSKSREGAGKPPLNRNACIHRRFISQQRDLLNPLQLRQLWNQWPKRCSGAGWPRSKRCPWLLLPQWQPEPRFNLKRQCPAPKHSTATEGGSELVACVWWVEQVFCRAAAWHTPARHTPIAAFVGCQPGSGHNGAGRTGMESQTARQPDSQPLAGKATGAAAQGGAHK